MNCSSCGDKGIIKINWADAPNDFAVCLCSVGQRMRRMTNERHVVAALWQVWCAREQVNPSRVFMLEDALTDEELCERGFTRPNAFQTAKASREAALLAAGRTKAKR